MDPLTCSLAVLVSTALGGGSGARALPVTVQDDALLLNRPPAQVQNIAGRMAKLGVDRVRLTAGWSVLAPSPRAAQVPKFDAANSDAYPRAPMAKLDRAVRAVTDAGMQPQVDVAFFAPRWAVTRVVLNRHPNRHRWRPDARRFGQFAQAMAERYSGAHPDPARAGRRLPAVRIWTTWNEPNHPAFLLPQWTREDGRWVPRSPYIYRALHERGYAAIKAVNPDNQVLIGGLAAEGMERRGPRKAVPPLQFLRALACVDRRLVPLRTRECQNFKPLQADGFSQHPYSLYGPPDAPSAERDYVRMGDLDKLSRLLEGLYRRGRIAKRLSIFVTEYGYETNPPDVVRGVTLKNQARYHGLATFLAWQRPDVASFAQFLLQDIPPPPHPRSDEDASQNWQTGLYFHDGRPKPAVQAFKIPFWAEARAVAGGQQYVLLFGQVRPSEGRKRAVVEVRGSDGLWYPIRTLDARPNPDGSCGPDAPEFLTDEEGFFLRVAPYQGEFTYRAAWIKADGSAERGVPITVDEPRVVPAS